MEYTVTIRTLGTAGEKYQKTLDSIKRQTIQPKDIIVVIPYGYSEPKEKLGYERFVYSEKGMLSQRIMGINLCTTELILAIDDDVEFQNDFIESMIKTLESTKADFVSPITREINFSDTLKAKNGNILSISNIKDWLMGISYKSYLESDYMVEINRAGGFVINSNIIENKQYYNQSGHGTCVFGKTQNLKDIRFEEEMYLQDTKYALPEDMVMFYKIFLYGNKIAINRSVEFIHLDAGTSLMNVDKKLNNIFASARNGLIFWYKFVYTERDKKLLSILCFIRRIFFTCLFSFIKGIVYLDFQQFKTYIKAYIDGFKYIKSDKYKPLNIKK